jgi:hypothetical protein
MPQVAMLLPVSCPRDLRISFLAILPVMMAAIAPNSGTIKKLAMPEIKLITASDEV